MFPVLEISPTALKKLQSIILKLLPIKVLFTLQLNLVVTYPGLPKSLL